MKRGIGDKGVIQVYMGDGKGKTTAAFGQAIRAAGNGFKVKIIQFMKNIESGEIKFLGGSDIEIAQYGRDQFVRRENLADIDFQLARKGLEEARASLHDFDLLILDEINVVLDFGLLKVGEVLEVLDEKPETTELILTGRNPPKEIIDRADLVSEVKKIKHPFDKDIPGARGREY